MRLTRDSYETYMSTHMSFVSRVFFYNPKTILNLFFRFFIYFSFVARTPSGCKILSLSRSLLESSLQVHGLILLLVLVLKNTIVTCYFNCIYEYFKYMKIFVSKSCNGFILLIRKKYWLSPPNPTNRLFKEGLTLWTNKWKRY